MARRRDYHAEYEARQRRSHEEGWKSYGQKRKAYNDAEAKLGFRDEVRKGRVDSSEQTFAAYYRALWDKKDRKSNAVDGAKAYWFVEVVGAVPSYRVWYERYVRGR